MVARCKTSVPMSEQNVISLRAWETRADKFQRHANKTHNIHDMACAQLATDSYFVWLEKACEHYTPENWRERNPLDHRGVR